MTKGSNILGSSVSVSKNFSTARIRCFSAPNDKLSAVVAFGSFLVAHPAFALVDDRLAGEGTGKALGINDPILGWVIIGVFATVWAVYFTATKELGGQGEEDGLGL